MTYIITFPNGDELILDEVGYEEFINDISYDDFRVQIIK